MKGFIAIFIIALVVAGIVSTYHSFEQKKQEEMSRAYAMGYENGYFQGTYNPAQEIHNQIHNEGFNLGFFSGEGQPIWIERNGWDKNNSLGHFVDVDRIIVLANISTRDVCVAQGKPLCRDIDLDYYKVILKHYSGWGSEGWDSPEFVLEWERRP